MSKIFYDNLIKLEKIEKIIKSSSLSIEEKEEMWKIVDEIIHHRVMGCILDNLDSSHHDEFIEKFTHAPFDEGLIDYLEEKSNSKISDKIKQEIIQIENEILKDIKN